MTGDEISSASRRHWEFDIRLPATPREVSRVREALRGLGLPPLLLEEAELLATELVTNSVKHAGLQGNEPVRISARWSGARLRVDVFDKARRQRAVAGGIRPSPGAESGWGLFLIDRLASRWGSARGHYWFELVDHARSG